MENIKDMQIFIFIGFSGVGKSMIMNALINGDEEIEPLNLQYLVTCTTRKPREVPIKETNGKDYNFLTIQEFEGLKKIPNFEELSFYEIKKICENKGYKECIVEETNYANVTYGILYSEVKKIFDIGKHAIVIVDRHGISEMKRIFGEKNVHSIFIYRDLEEVRKEIENRNVSKQEVERRMEKAKKDIEESMPLVDYVVYNTNKTKKEIIEEVKEIIQQYI